MSCVPTTAGPPQEARGRTWLRAALALLAFALWTLTPFELRPPDPSDLFSVAADDLAGNLLVTVPIGWLLAAALGVRRAIVLMVLTSVAVEGCQLMIVSRDAALSDVLANATGATIGAFWWRRPHPPAASDALFVAVACWGVAMRYGAPNRPTVTVALVLAWAIAVFREEPARSPDVAGYALVASSGFLGLSPVPLVTAAFVGVAVGVFLPRSLRNGRRALGGLATVAYAVECWPPLRVATARAADPPLMVAELVLLLATLALLMAPAGSSPAGSDSPATSTEPSPSRSRSDPP